MDERRSYWFATAPAETFPALSGTVEVDVAIVGGGIVGITAARLMKDAGLKVAVVEALRVGGEVTGKSTAKITSQHSVTYTEIERRFGEDGARIYAEANEAGLERIVRLAAEHGIDCELERDSAYTYTNEQRHVAELEAEVALARRLGLPARMVEETPLPHPVLAAMRWDDQARFHPVKYVAGLARTVPGEGSHVFERSRVVDWDTDSVETDAGKVKARHVLMATHLPLGQIGFLYSEAHPHVHPVLMGRCDPARAPAGMFINVEQPRYSVRPHRDAAGDTWLILAGTSFKHGHVDEERKHFADLEDYAARHFGVTPEYRWTNEDYSPVDGAPFVGWSSSIKESYLVATGFNAWGITNGTAAAMLLTELALGREHPWLKLYDASRVKPVAGAKEFVKGNVEVAAHLVGGYLGSKPRSFDELAAGDAAILKIDGDHVAAYRDGDGTLHSVSAVCTHMGCLVGWNETDRTWDCPCHGSRFELDGSVLHGPAVRPLGSKITG